MIGFLISVDFSWLIFDYHGGCDSLETEEEEARQGGGVRAGMFFQLLL